MKCPNCNKRLLTRKERKDKHCLRCGHDFSLIKGKVEFSKELNMKKNKISVYILHKIDKKYLLNSLLKCQDCGKDPIYVWQYKIDLHEPLQTTWWLCKGCIKKRFKQFLKGSE